MSSDDLLAELLAKPVGPTVQTRKAQPSDMTQELEVSGNRASATLVGEPGSITEGKALEFLQSEGLNPLEWEVSSFRKSVWGRDGEMEAVRFSFVRSQNLSEPALLPDELVSVLSDHKPRRSVLGGSHGFLVLLGDMQFGKIDGDGPAGTLARTIDCINKAADAYVTYADIFDFGHVHIAWLGDHIEGFVSQGGANAWRTQLTLNEQIRLTQAVMLHALKTFAPLTERLTMAAVPGNHGESVRFEGKGLTRYDDSHDTESLISIKNTIETLEVAGFEHVQFFVPDTDELIVLTEVAGTVVAHAHGHKFGSRKDAVWDWWEGQAFNRESPMYVADLLVAGHLHHEHIEANGSRLFIQVPSMESESTWFRHNTGAGGAPGLIVAITKDGQTPIKQTITSGGKCK